MKFTILTPLVSRVGDIKNLTCTSKTEVFTFMDYAKKYVRVGEASAICRPERWLVFVSAIDNCRGKIKDGILNDSDSQQYLFQVLESLTSHGVKHENIENAAKSSRLWKLTREMHLCYEELLQKRNIMDLHSLYDIAQDKIISEKENREFNFVFDLMHEARPDEFELAMAISQNARSSIFLCDDSAPALQEHPVVANVGKEIKARLVKLLELRATELPNRKIGSMIVDGTLTELPDNVELIEFNDHLSQLRGLASRAASAGKASFLLTNPERDLDILLYELKETGFPEKKLEGFGFFSVLEREFKILLNLLSNPENEHTWNLALNAGMVKNKKLLEEKAELLSDMGDSTNLEETVKKGVEIFFDDLTETENEYMNIYLEAAGRYENLVGSGNVRKDLDLFTRALSGYMSERKNLSCAFPRGFITSCRPAERIYDEVLIPSLVTEKIRNIPDLAGFDKHAKLIETKTGLPFFLPKARNPERTKWEVATTAAAAEKVVFTYYRQEAGRSVRPARWLRPANANAAVGNCAFQVTRVLPITFRNISTTEPVNSISVSAISTYMKCPYKYYLENIAGLRTEASQRQLLGSFIHKVLADFHAPGKKDFSTERLEELFERTSSEFSLDYENLMEARTLLESYIAEGIGLNEKTLAVEQPFAIELAGVNIRGRIDRIVEVPGGVKLIDYKLQGRGKERRHKNAVLKTEDVQLPIYMHGAKKMGYEVVAFSYIYLDFEKQGKPLEITIPAGCEPAKNIITKNELLDTINKVEAIVGEIAKGKPEFVKGENPPCENHMSWCDFKGMCIYEFE